MGDYGQECRAEDRETYTLEAFAYYVCALYVQGGHVVCLCSTELHRILITLSLSHTCLWYKHC